MSDQLSLRSKGDVIKELLEKCDTWEEKISLLMNELIITQNNARLDKKSNEELKERIREMEVEIRNQDESIQSLKYNNERFTKRIKQLNHQLDQNKSSKGILSALWGSDNTNENKLKEEVDVIKEQLFKNISENEELTHKLLSQKETNQKIEIGLKTEQKKSNNLCNKLERELAETNEINSVLNNDLNTLRHNHDVLGGEKKSLEKGLAQVKGDLEFCGAKKAAFDGY